MNLMDISDRILEMRPFGPGQDSVHEAYHLDMTNQCLWRREQRILVDPKAFALLCALIEHAGQLVTKNELLDTVWSDEIVCEAVIRFQIRRIRVILQDNPRTPRFIETAHCRGYRFIGQLLAVKPQTVDQRRLPYGFVPALTKLSHSSLEFERVEETIS